MILLNELTPDSQFGSRRLLYSGTRCASTWVNEMKHKLLLVLAAIAIPGLSLGQDAGQYACFQGDLQRRLEIVYETGGVMPCEVHYYKDTEAPGEHQVLWSASNELGYCEAKTRECIARLEDWGWDCGPEATAAAEPQAFEADDTSELAPAEQSVDGQQ